MLSGNLEYVLTSLPNLSFNNSEAVQHEVTALFQKYAEVAETSGNLMSILDVEAKKYLSSGQYHSFQDITLKTIHQKRFQERKYKVVSEFSGFMRKLKQEIKAYRTAKKLDENTKTSDYEMFGTLSENPLEAEVELLNLQWKKLEELSIGHYADVSALILYKLKLELLLRWWSFNTDKGFALFQKTLNVA